MRAQINKLDFKGQNLYIGIDVHLNSWSVAVMSEGTLLKKFSQDPNADALHSFLQTNYPSATGASSSEEDYVRTRIALRLRTQALLSETDDFISRTEKRKSEILNECYQKPNDKVIM